MARWTAQTRVAADPADVLTLLTDPDAISRWAPIAFDLIDWEGERLVTGDLLRVRGQLGGQSLEFEVDVARADDGHLALTASGPIRIDVEYRARAAQAGSHLHACVDVSGRGLLGRMLAGATDALLASGALRLAVDRLAHELEPALAA